MRQRIRAPLKFAAPFIRTSQHGTCRRSAATASRRVAVKSSTAGSPQISPMTALRAGHLRPSSIAHKASRASRASTWMISIAPSPAGCTRPLSKIAIRSCTHSSGLAGSICGSRKPAQPPSRGLVANSSDRIGSDCAGSFQFPCAGRGPDARSAPTASPDWAPAFAGVQISAARLPPPATRESSAATRLATLLFYFCSNPASQQAESMQRLGKAHFLAAQRPLTLWSFRPNAAAIELS